MNFANSEFTVAEYCGQVERHEIRVNHDYQRSPRVWPAAARSFLIDSILHGFPISKILLRQSTDLTTRRTTKEVIDGQQRTQAIVDFFKDKLTITLRDSDFYGRKFTTLDDESKHRFLEYPVSTEIFSATTDDEIREIFRRLNSYNVPLNKQELRHAVNQGDFKWFVHSLTVTYAQSLKSLGVVTEKQINRMADAEFFTHVLAAMANGIETSDVRKLDQLYKSRDRQFTEQDEFKRFIDHGMTEMNKYSDQISTSRLSAKHNSYSLLLAFGNAHVPLETLSGPIEFDTRRSFESEQMVASNLSELAAALDDWERERDEASRSISPSGPLADFVRSTIEGTNIVGPRRSRFIWFSKALLPIPLGESC